jgi:hypothetical protein
MLNLPQVTILTINCVDPREGINAMYHSMKNIAFKEAILFTHLPVWADGITVKKINQLKSVDEYNDFVLRLAEYVDSDYVLVVQDDGFVTNADNWDNEFLKYDYIGAPWPKDPSWIELQRAKEWMTRGFNQIGNGGFSLRSRRFLELSAEFTTCNGYGEDVFLTCINNAYMKAGGVKFPSIGLAKRFSYENNLADWKHAGEFDISQHFGFHGKNFSNHQQLIALKNHE